jgi:hypothetical protein
MPGRCSASHARWRAAAVLFAALAVVASIASPVLAATLARDRDRDGVSNHHELRRSHTNPGRADTDRDGLKDGFELRRSHTNPRRADTDRDGLKDRFELRGSHTNPRRRDTDHDGVSDRVELRLGTDPSSPSQLPGNPTPATTGVPNGWQPSRVHTGDVTITKDNKVIDGWLVTGEIEVAADNVTIRNSRVYQRIFNVSGQHAYNGLVVEDTEIGPPTGNNGETNGSLGAAGYIARRVHIHNSTEGFRVGGYTYSSGEAGPVTIEDSFVDLDSRTGECAHSDGVQGYDEPRSIRIDHNTIDMRNVDCSTAPIYVGNDNPTTIDVTDNLLMGGSYTLRLHADAGVGNVHYPEVTGNRLVRGEWDWGPVLVDTCAAIGQWSDNRLVTIDSQYRVTSTVRRLKTC